MVFILKNHENEYCKKIMSHYFGRPWKYVLINWIMPNYFWKQTISEMTSTVFGIPFCALDEQQNWLSGKFAGKHLTDTQNLRCNAMSTATKTKCFCMPCASKINLCIYSNKYSTKTKFSFLIISDRILKDYSFSW